MGKDRERPHPTKGNAAAADTPTGRGNCPVLVVGIGASERGLNSVTQLFAGMSSGHGVAFVLIQHLGSTQENRAVKELSDQKTFSVVEATDGMEVLADRIHVLPAGKFLNITGSILRLQEPVQCNGVWMPIDHFFCALAADQGSRGCGILLSGTGSDGTLGLSEIKATGGRTIVEKPGTAEFAAITQRAINAGFVDGVVPIEAMAETIVALAEQVIADTRNLPAEAPEFDANLKDILDILRAKVGHDFRCYKPNTLVRRTRRRMTLAKTATFAEYANFLAEHPEEVGLLQKDLLIGVTDFFRQPPAWDILEKKAIADILEQTKPGAEIRFWVPGCSTGQEVYSLAMLLAEKVEATDKKVAIQIFATDSDVSSFGIARSGTYSAEAIGKNVSPERLKRFFMRKDDQYQIIKELRDQIVFAPQNLTSDPPFSKLDLVSCRNLLMYLEQSVQKKIIALFHFSLRQGGYLFLGTAETVGDREDLFEPISKKWRIYRRIGVGRSAGVDIPVRPTSESLLAAGRLPMAATRSRLSLTSAAHQMLLDRFTPACVMIDRKLRVLYVHGAVEHYLTFPPGELTTRVVDMAREGLRARLRGAIGKSLEVGKPVSITARVRRGSTGLTKGGQKSVAVKATVSPLRYPREVDGLLLITFEDYRLPVTGATRKGAGKSDLRPLEDELKITREELQSTIEQVENSNDQLKAYNEEVTAANEELQSANEELETSKEELLSLNEELNTINARLQEKVEELESANNDMVNLLSSTSIATVFLDKELKVKRYTPASTRLFSLIPSDIGRPIRDVLRHFTDAVLVEEAARVLAELTPLSKEVQCEDRRWYIRRITPYRTQDDRIEGVVVAFMEVTELKQSEDALRRAKEEWERTFDSVPDLIAILDERHRVVRANRAMAERLGRTPDECVGLPCYTAVHGTDVPPAFCPHVRTLNDCLEHTAEVHEERLGGHFLVSTTPICDEHGKMIGSVHVARDITESKKAEEMIRSVALFPEENPFPILRVAGDATLLYANRAAEALLDQWHCRVGTPVPEFVQPKLSTALRKGTRQELEVRFGEQELSFVLIPVIERDYVNFYGRDITEHKRAEEALQRERSVLDGIMKATDVMLVYLDPDFNFVAVNPAYAETCKMRPEDMIGKNHFTLYPDAENEAIFRRVRDTGEPVFYKDKPFEFPDQPERGVTYWDWSLTPVKDAPGHVIGLVFSLRETTKHKHAEEALRESEERYRSLFDNMTEGFALHEIITDKNGRPCDYRFLSINPSFERLTGLKREEVLGKRVLEVLPDNDPHWIEAYGKVALTGEPMHFENFATPLNRWYEVFAYRPAPRQFAVIFMDITTRKQAENTLRRYELLSANSRDIILFIRRDDGRILEANAAAWNTYGYSRDELLTLTIQDLRAPETQGLTVAQMAEADTQGLLFETVHRRKNGNTFPVEVSSQGAYIGGTRTLIGVIRDITERKAAEAALRSNEELLMQAIRVSGLGIFEHDQRNDIIYWSPEMRQICGVSQDESATIPTLLERVHPDDRERVAAAIGAAHEPAGDGVFAVEHRLVWPDGSVRWLTRRGQTFFEGEGSARRPVRTVGAVFDITERKRAEEGLRKSRDELELRVQERTEELERRNKELQEFVFVAAHDLREPLRKIQTFGDLVVKKSGDALSDDGRDYITRMQRAAARMQHLLGSLLSYSRVTTQAEPFQDTDLSKSLEVALSNLEIVITEKKVRLEVGQLPTLQADAVQMVQLFQNLISNALKFQGGDHIPSVKIYAKAIENQFGRKNAYEICVEDNGIGFDEQYLDKIFKPFQRLHGREEYEGVGIGLAICRKIVEHHGGILTARSTVGQGSTFIITLPIKQGARGR